MAAGTVARPATMVAAISKIAGKFQVTVPPDIRRVYQLCEGDLLEWQFDPQTERLMVVPKRAQLITPQLEDDMKAIKKERGLPWLDRVGEISKETKL